MIYADYAASSPILADAYADMVEALRLCHGNASSLHREGQYASELLMIAREHMACSLGCNSSEIVFTSGGTESDNLAIWSAAQKGWKTGQKHIVTSVIEHHAVLHTLDALRPYGFEITAIPVGKSGIVNSEAVRNAIRSETCLITIMTANNEIGTVQQMAEIGAICAERGVTFHTDAVQAVGHIPVDVRKWNVDMLSLSAHKFGGPEGVGALFCSRQNEMLFPMIHGGPQEHGIRAGTENVPGIVGMQSALTESRFNMSREAERLTALRDRLIDGLTDEIDGCSLNGHRHYRLPGIANFCFDGVDGTSLAILLDKMGICVSTGSACNSESLEPSHVLLAIGRTKEQARSAIRISLGWQNTENDIDILLEKIPEAVKKLRR